MPQHEKEPPIGAHRPPDDRADLDLAARIAVEVQTCPLVAGLHGGDHDAIATDTAAGRLVGVVVDRDAIVVGVVCRQLAGVDAVVAQVRAAVALQAPATSVSVSVVARHDPETDAVTHR